MKKIGILLILLLFPLNASASVIVMDSDTSRVLYGVNHNEKKLIASTSKIMTAMVVINNADLDEVITVGENVLRSFGSGIYIEVGEEISIKDLLYGLMLRSGNDAAIVLAEHVGGSEEGFAVMMNETALAIGMNDTTFINASGLENDEGEGNISTAHDMALLMSYAMQNEAFKEITGTYHYMVSTNYKTYDWYNKNKLLTSYEYTTGGKTGYTQKADRTLVTSASKDGKNLVVVTLDEEDDFNIHESLYERLFEKYKLVEIIDAKTFLKDEEQYVNDSFSMLLSDDEIDKISIEITYTNDAIDRLGFVSVLLDGNEYYRENIYVIESEEELSFFEKVKRFFLGLFGA